MVKKKQVADRRNEVSEMLDRLQERLTKPSIELLSSTKIGAHVQKIANPDKTPGVDDEVRSKAAALVAMWRKRVAKLERKSARPVKKKKKATTQESGMA